MSEWIQDVFIQMRSYRIKQDELAKRCGYSRTYINKVLNQKEKLPKNGKMRIVEALNELIAEKTA